MKLSKKFFPLLILFVYLFFPKIALADDFDHIGIDVYIDENGIGEVKEEWQIDESDNDFTERYKEIKNLKKIKIEDFSVRLNDKNFRQKDPWDVDQNFEQKAYKYGRIDKDDSLELCWGISEKEKENTYTLTYKINPIIVGLNDSDMLFYDFIGEDLDPKPNKIAITINTYKNLEKDIKIWAFGFTGDISKDKSSIISKSTGEVNRGVIMIKFPKNTFATSFKEDKSFKDYADTAIKDSKWEDSEGKVLEDKFPFKIFFLIILGLFAIIGLSAKVISDANPYKIHNIKDISDIKNIEKLHSSNIPYDGNLEDLFLLLINAYPLEDNFANLINAFLLKWINEGAITFIKDEKDHGVFDKNLDKITINKAPTSMGKVEKSFFSYLEEASKKRSDSSITESSFEDYMEDKDESLLDSIESVENESLESLVKKGYVEKIQRKKNKQKLLLTPTGMDLYKNILSFKNYLEDYENIDIENIESPQILDLYIIYAALFGISEKIYKSFEKIYPDYGNNSFYNYYLINQMHSYSSTASSAGSFDSAGYGGSSSFSGGGGSFGGGGGGGR